MADLIERKPLYEQTAKLEAQALDYIRRLIERYAEEPSEEWRVWSAILIERTAFKHDVFDAPSAEPEIVRCKDCKYYNPIGVCIEMNCAVCEDSFCCWAERRTDETDD